MAAKKKPKNASSMKAQDDTPPGATRRAFDREDNGGGPPGSPLGDRHAQGTPAGGTETGGLGGSNIGDGSPVETPEVPPENIEGLAYSGHAGGAVGGSPAGRRSKQKSRPGRGLAPGGVHRGDSTLGSDPNKG